MRRIRALRRRRKTETLSKPVGTPNRKRHSSTIILRQCGGIHENLPGEVAQPVVKRGHKKTFLDAGRDRIKSTGKISGHLDHWGKKRSVEEKQTFFQEQNCGKKFETKREHRPIREIHLEQSCHYESMPIVQECILGRAYVEHGTAAHRECVQAR